MVIGLLTQKPDANKLKAAIEKRLGKSRFQIPQFTVRSFSSKRYRGGHISIHQVRLKDKRLYRGHSVRAPKAINRCRIKSSFLHPLDWIEFMDILNDVMDDLQISANAYTSVLVFRQGKRRRMRYQKDDMGWIICRPIIDEPGVWIDKYFGSRIHPQSEFDEQMHGAYRSLHNKHNKPH